MDYYIKKDSLVIYKKRPAVVLNIGEKLEIREENGDLQYVRPKDVTLLHPGPVGSLHTLRRSEGDVETAWELTAGQVVSLPDLAELIYGDFTPSSALSLYRLVEEGQYFRWQGEMIQVSTPEVVEKERLRRKGIEAEHARWDEFILRLRQKAIEPQDRRYLQEVEELACGRRSESRVLRALDRNETPQSAHASLLEWGYWSVEVDPYPIRNGTALSSPELPLPEIPAEERVDLTHLAAFAIDDEGNQEPDDAIGWDGESLWVHVADAACLVPPGSPADQEACSRGANLYLPEGAVRMLPDGATRKLGLGLSEISPALSFQIRMNDVGEITGFNLCKSWIKAQRLTYEQADLYIHDEPFNTLYRLASSFKDRRIRQGAVEIDLPEVKVTVDGGVVQLKQILPLRSRETVREMMLLAGEAVGRYCLEHHIAMAYAVQEPSSLDAAPTRVSPSMAEMYARRRASNRSHLARLPGLHAGLGLHPYVRVTSPLRRYPDLAAHQQLRAYLQGDRLMDENELFERINIAEASTAVVNATESLARRHWTLVYLLQSRSWGGLGILVDKRGRSGRLILPELALETSVYVPEDTPLDTQYQVAAGKINLPELELNLTYRPVEN